MIENLLPLKNILDKYRYSRELLLAQLVSAFVVLALALLWPLPEPTLNVGVQSNGLQSAVLEEKRQTDLAAFKNNRRWGQSLSELEAEQKSTISTQLNPELKKIGFVGVINVNDQKQVLLILPDGSTKRYKQGDTLPDGRLLVAISGHALSLSDEQQQTQVLQLFPVLKSEEPSVSAAEDSKLPVNTNDENTTNN